MLKSKKLWITIAAVIIVFAGGWYGYTKLRGNTQLNQQQATRSAAVTRGDIATTVTGTGTIAAAEKETIKAGTDGTVKEALVKEGDVVKKGQTLVTFVSKDMTNQIKQEQLNLQQKQLNLDSAELDLKKLAQDGNLDLDDKKINISKLKLDIESSQLKINDYLDQQAPPDPIIAPIDGKITSLSAGVGDDLKANAEIAQIINLDKLNVAISVDELDIVKMKTGMTAQVAIDALPGKSVEGQVTEVADEGTAQNGVSVFAVTISLNKTEDVKVGMTAQSVINVEEKKGVLLLPIEAVQQVQGRYLVFMPSAEGAGANGSGGKTGANGEAAGTNGKTGANGAGNKAGESAAAGTSVTGEKTRTSGTNGGFQRSGATGATGGNGTVSANGNAGRQPVLVEVGIHNETFIEITSGLKEGDKVILPTVVSSSGSQQANIRVGGAGGFGGFGGGGGGNVVTIPKNAVNRGGGGGGNK